MPDALETLRRTCRKQSELQNTLAAMSDDLQRLQAVNGSLQARLADVDEENTQFRGKAGKVEGALIESARHAQHLQGLIAELEAKSANLEQQLASQERDAEAAQRIAGDQVARLNAANGELQGQLRAAHVRCFTRRLRLGRKSSYRELGAARR